MHTYQIVLEQDPLFWLGDRFFKVGEEFAIRCFNNRVVFTSKCPSCNGERKITYRGYNGSDFECECPICTRPVGQGYGDRIELKNWVIHEYIVYKIEARGAETISAYKDGIGYMNSLTLTAFSRFGRGSGDFIQTHVPWTENNVDRNIETIGVNAFHFNADDYVFRKKADAEKFLSVLKARDKQRLAEFNKTYGTDYEYPF